MTELPDNCSPNPSYRFSCRGAPRVRTRIAIADRYISIRRVWESIDIWLDRTRYGGSRPAADSYASSRAVPVRNGFARLRFG
jgi:hypothetical protein